VGAKIFPAKALKPIASDRVSNLFGNGYTKPGVWMFTWRIDNDEVSSDQSLSRLAQLQIFGALDEAA